VDTCEGSRTRARCHDLDVGDIFSDDLQAIDERGGYRNGGAVLIVVEDGYLHPFAQLAFNDEAFRRLDVFEVDPAEGRFQACNDLHQLVRVRLVDLDVKYVDSGKLLEKNGLALHDGLRGKRPNVTQPQYRRAVGDYAHQVAASGITEGVHRVFGDF